MIKIIRVGRECLREAYEIVNKVDQGMDVPEWFVAEPYEEFDFWMNILLLMKRARRELCFS